MIGRWPGWLTVILQCYDTVGWIIWHVKSWIVLICVQRDVKPSLATYPTPINAAETLCQWLWEHWHAENTLTGVIGCRYRSVCLLMQTALPCMLLARGPIRLQLRGGTNAAFAPQIDYFMLVRNVAIQFDVGLSDRPWSLACFYYSVHRLPV